MQGAVFGEEFYWTRPSRAAMKALKITTVCQRIAKSVIETADKEVKHKTKQTNRKEFIGNCAAETKQAER